MTEKVLIGIVLFSVISYCCALNVSQCHNSDKVVEDLSERVKVGNCKKPPCRLRKNSNIPVEVRFKSDEDADKIVNSISAYIAGVPFPFPGIDQTDACESIYSLDGKTKLGCPLKKGEEYLYKKTIEVLQIYPRLKLVVHWAVTPPSGKDVLCFETPARITN